MEVSHVPEISVIVPVYNVQDHVSACLRSLKQQTYQDFEAILIDDGSTDSSAQRAREAIAGDPRFRFFDQSNQGLSEARNHGLSQARGRCIAFVDSDDTISPDYLARLHQALEDNDADWVACGIRFRDATGTLATHSAIHDAPSLSRHAAVERYSLKDWSAVIRHFPSAWNKLYRRQLIEGLRFDKGTWFEDHGFFYRAAQRTDHLLHVPEPLYIQTRNRTGQITAADDNRVFEQFDVLETMRDLMQAPPPAGHAKSGAETAFPKIASRLLFERSASLKEPDRRARFAQASHDWMQRQDLSYTPDWDPTIARSWALEMTGTLPLSVVLPWHGHAPEHLCRSLESLTSGWATPGREILIVCDTSAAEAKAKELSAAMPEVRVLRSPDTGVGPARNCGLAAARGQYICFLDAGDLYLEAALAKWTELMLANDADIGIARFRIGFSPDSPADSIEHSGFRDLPEAPARLSQTGPLPLADSDDLTEALDTQLSAKIFRRAFLQDLHLQCGPGAWSERALVIAASVLATRPIYIAEPGVWVCTNPAAQTQLHRKLSGHRFLTADRQTYKLMPKAARDRLPEGWRMRLFSRALSDTLAVHKARRGTFGEALFLLQIAGHQLWSTLPLLFSAPPKTTTLRHRHDPYIGTRIKFICDPWATLKSQIIKRFFKCRL
ncbi:MAG: glycosyltransferase [Shimia sp.]|nr:glycosyltransferase [Shimia sp.]